MNFYPICLNCATERRTYLGPGTSSASSGRSPRIRVDTPGFRTPGSRLDSTRGQAVTRGVQLQGFDFAMFQAGSGGAGFQVASQKSGPVASDVPRFARQHTNVARKEPRTQWVSPLDPGRTLRWTPEANGAASACALLSRAYWFSNGLDEMCKALRCTPENFLRGRFFLTADWRFR